MKRKLIGLLGIVAVLAGIWIYRAWFGTTEIAFVNFQAIAMGNISKANDNSFIRIREVGTDELGRLSRFDMVFINGMGLRIVEEERKRIEQAADRGIPVYTSMATNPRNAICNLDSLDRKTIGDYLRNGGVRNYRNLLAYVRQRIDRKLIAAPRPEAPVERPSDILYHPGIRDSREEAEFTSVSGYEKFLRENGLYKDRARKIVVTGQMADATALITALEREGYRVYPVSSLRKLLGFLQEIGPDAVINMAHGRLGDRMVEYLKERNIPLFSPLTVNSLVKEWEEDPMGMSGGFLSQSVVTPEIDGAIRTYALFAQYTDEEGLRRSYAVPERLETFVKNLNAYLALKNKPNAEKRVAVYYYKGPGQNAMTAAGMEVAPSLYRLLCRLKAEGYRVEGLPAQAKEFERLIMAQGAVFGTYAEGALDAFLKTGNPEWITKEEYEGWVKKALRSDQYAEVVKTFGEFPGSHRAASDGRLGIGRLQFGNVVLIPQEAAGAGDNSFRMVHGTQAAPPHAYVASYLWVQYGFKADALIHFGTHGSLEFTPRKQVALCSKDWPDRLVGALPHFYVYSIGNVGEGMIAKRRSYAGLQSYLTPPFMESGLRGIYRDLMEKIKVYNHSVGQLSAGQPVMPADLNRASLAVKSAVLKMGIHRELGLDSAATQPYTEEEVARIENFAEELATEKITGQLYTMGVPYEPARIRSSVLAMTIEPLAYSLLTLDKQRGKAGEEVLKHKPLFTQRYLTPAREWVERLFDNPRTVSDEMICRITGVTAAQLAEAREIEKERNTPKGMGAMMMALVDASADVPAGYPGEKRETDSRADTKISGSVSGATARFSPETEDEKSAKTERKREETAGKKNASAGLATVRKKSARPEKQEAPAMRMPSGGGMTDRRTALKKGMSKKEYTKEERERASALLEVERALRNIENYKQALLRSPGQELGSLMNALGGGYTPPSPGGDPIVNPNTLPTGRNLFAINAEETPTESAWEKGKQLAESTVEMYRKRHKGEYPKKVSYTLWSGEFIETGGATIAQVLYMLGVEPVRDDFGRVSDLKLIPSAELRRPRIDVVVQTSGQLRDLAASRLFLVNRAVEMAAAAKEDGYENQVAIGVTETERLLTEKGISPKEAREMSVFRVFGGANGNYGTGIQGMVEAGDRWEEESEIAATYLHNMGAYYGNEKNWEKFREYAFEAALARTDVVVQPRQSNTWGALSLDHVYEFMGGMNLAVRKVTGKDPDAYFSDYRNRNHNRMQELKEAIGIESRTTLFNPAFIREKMKGEASSAAVFAETIRNTYGWNVMKPAVVGKEMWDELYEVYVKDKFGLGVKSYFERQNPAALQEITAVMLESVRKGLWKAGEGQVADIVKLHTDLVNKYRPSCSGFVCDNGKLRNFIASRAEKQAAAEYKKNISEVREAVPEKQGMVMKKEEMASRPKEHGRELDRLWMMAGMFAGLTGLIILMRKRRKNLRSS